MGINKTLLRIADILGEEIENEIILDGVIALILQLAAESFSAGQNVVIARLRP